MKFRTSLSARDRILGISFKIWKRERVHHVIIFYPDGTGGLPVLDHLNLGLTKHFTARSPVPHSVAPLCLLHQGKRPVAPAGRGTWAEQGACQTESLVLCRDVSLRFTLHLCFSRAVLLPVWHLQDSRLRVSESLQSGGSSHKEKVKTGK